MFTVVANTQVQGLWSWGCVHFRSFKQVSQSFIAWKVKFIACFIFHNSICRISCICFPSCTKIKSLQLSLYLAFVMLFSHGFTSTNVYHVLPFYKNTVKTTSFSPQIHDLRFPMTHVIVSSPSCGNLGCKLYPPIDM